MMFDILFSTICGGDRSFGADNRNIVATVENAPPELGNGIGNDEFFHRRATAESDIVYPRDAFGDDNLDERSTIIERPFADFGNAVGNSDFF